MESQMEKSKMHRLSKPQKLIYDMEKYAGGSVGVICGSMIEKGSRTLVELEAAVNELYRCNDALRIHIAERDEGTFQTIAEYEKKAIEVLYFKDKAELDSYGAGYAKEPLDLYGSLCEIKIVILPGGYGILVKLHHLVGDAWTLALVCTKFNAYLAGQSMEPYAYIRWLDHEKRYVQSERYRKDRTFFLEQFKECDEVVYLSEKQNQSYAGSRRTFIVKQEQARQLMDYAGDNNASAFAVFMAALAVYIGRIKLNAERFYLGTAILNRSSAERNIMGMFVNTVPMLVKINYEESFAWNLVEIKKTIFSMIRHQKYNYGDVLTEIRKEYGFSERLYDVMLSYQNAAIAGADAEFESTWYHSGAQVESLQIHIDDRDGEGIFKIHFDYQTDKFTECEIECMYGHIMNLLSDAMENREKRVKDLEILSADERHRLLYDFNDTAMEYPKDKCVQELFAEQAAKMPDAEAVIACDRALTYRELDERANRIANRLIENGVKVGDIVAFVLPRRSCLFAAMFGILKSGAAFLPVDPAYPKERIQYMLEDSGAKFCITEDNIEEMMSGGNGKDPMVCMSSENPCYCIYTSGSTGRPKGALLKHRSMVNLSHEVMRSVFRDSCRSIASTATVSFDIFMTESIVPIVNGMKVLFVNEEQAKLQSELNSFLKENPADAIQTTPSKLKALISDPLQNEYLKHLKVIVLGGESLEKELINTLEQFTAAKIFNIYGPTETTIYAAIAGVCPEDEEITIGRPIANTQIYITDKYMNLMPVGVTGELCIAGDGVGKGYVNHPELTAERFEENPFGQGELYKTGDLACWREDGNITYVGRNDFQVKIRGLRIELGEIENALCGVGGISQAVAVVRKNDDGRQMICAFYTGEKTDDRTLRGSIAGRLLKYMLPHIFVHLDKMPLTASGKVDRSALPEVELNNVERHTEYVKPKGELERRLAALMEQTLKHSPIGREDHFFDDLGGDSLHVIEFVSKAHSDGIYFSVQSVFDCPTVARLAAYMKDGDKPEQSFAKIDFTDIQNILAKNRTEYISVQKEAGVGNILLTGATGYFGIHILADFLEHDEGIAICLVRERDGLDAKSRLLDALAFYFGDKYTSLADSRIRVILADLQKERFGMTETEYKALYAEVDIVINAAASVKHYGSYLYFYEKNVETVKRIIDFCMQSDTKLIHISTMSVSGFSAGDVLDFDESSFFVGQSLDNVYIRSKFEAEKEIFDAMGNGLSAKIMRMGNLTNRICDGKFQKNYESNAFLKRMKAIMSIGILPDDLMEYPLEFTPVDEAARAVMTIAHHFCEEQNVFHISNPWLVPMEKLFDYLRECSVSMQFAGNMEFAAALEKTMEHEDTEFIYENLIGVMDSGSRLSFSTGVCVKNDFTVQYLKQLGFCWQPVTEDYLEKYYRYFKDIGYFM